MDSTPTNTNSHNFCPPPAPRRLRYNMKRIGKDKENTGAAKMMKRQESQIIGEADEVKQASNALAETETEWQDAQCMSQVVSQCEKVRVLKKSG